MKQYMYTTWRFYWLLRSQIRFPVCVVFCFFVSLSLYLINAAAFPTSKLPTFLFLMVCNQSSSRTRWVGRYPIRASHLTPSIARFWCPTTNRTNYVTPFTQLVFLLPPTLQWRGVISNHSTALFLLVSLFWLQSSTKNWDNSCMRHIVKSNSLHIQITHVGEWQNVHFISVSYFE